MPREVSCGNATRSYVSFESGIVEDASELVGMDIVIDLRKKELSLFCPIKGDRIRIPIAALRRVELSEQPKVVAHDKPTTDDDYD